MQIIKIVAITALVVYSIVLLAFAYKTKKTIKTLFFSALIGIITMTVLNLTSHYTGVYIAVNPWTVGSAATFGIPGVVALVTVRLFF
ncbi:MAG: pro-sigmaK processing inhibitor BofA family protein [Oscillospiraceae bacterium]|nr:pro-sigmaK processing inhibitor BofA family protein [Oscillospiraceae bacterium]